MATGACRGAVDGQAAQLHGRQHRAQRARFEVPEEARHDARAQRGYEYALRRGGVATPRDPLVLGGVVLAMLLLGLLATWIPAQRALSIDPMMLLRED